MQLLLRWQTKIFKVRIFRAFFYIKILTLCEYEKFATVKPFHNFRVQQKNSNKHLLLAEVNLVEELKDSKTQSQAFEVLVNTYKKRLYWHIRSIVLNHDDADDVLQNTFIKVFRNINNFKGDSKLYSWMYRIATNESLTFLKQKQKKTGISNEELQHQMLSNLEADVYFEGDDIQLKLQQAIATLPEKQKLVFNMKYFQELKYEEISQILETSVGGLKASYHYAIKKLEAYLKDT